MRATTLVIGLGEVGKPLMEVIDGHLDVVGIDLEPIEFSGACGVMHICFPFQIPDFVGTCVSYIDKYHPQMTIINSTVAPGTTRAIYERRKGLMAYSPVRGKHIKMRQELLTYDKFVGGIDEESGRKAAEHFQSVGMKARILSSPEAVELAKLTETTYFGVLIAWAQEVERYCDQLSVDYAEVISYYEEIKYLPPVKYFPGIIGGHCVMPNIAILQTVFDSNILDGIESSNEQKKQRDVSRQESPFMQKNF